MRILLCSHVFAPSIGGIEVVSAVLAEQFTRMGSEVTVVTQTPGDPVCANYKLVRQPSVRELWALGRRSDIIFQHNISLRTLMPLLWCGRPIVITHQGSTARADGSRSWQGYCKQALIPLCHNISPSNAIADQLPVRSILIGNPFESEEFTGSGEMTRDKDIVFLGRLVSDKGCDLALRALALLKQDGVCLSLTVIGDGPDMSALKTLAAALGIAAQVDFLGTIREGRGKEMARHRVMVIPSNWAEPFGVIALEGLAAGCVLAAARVGGLPEAVGPCGLLFPKGEVDAIAETLKSLIGDASLREKLMTERDRHLEGFRPETIARKYLDFFASVLH